MKRLPDDDYFAGNAAISKFTGSLERRGLADVFSLDHLLRTRLLLSNSFPGKSPGFFLAWLAVDFSKWITFPAKRCFQCLFVDNSPRIRSVNLRAAENLSESMTIAWMTSPPRRLRWPKAIGMPAVQDVVWSLGLPNGPRLGVYRRAAEIFSETRRSAAAVAADLDVPLSLGWWDCLMHGMLLARVENYCERHKIETVVLASDTEHFGIALAWAAHHRGAEVFVLQHGTLNPHNCFGVASHLFCWTDSIRRYAERTGNGGVTRKPLLRVTTVGGIHRPKPLPGPLATASDCLFLDQLSAHGLRMWGQIWVSETRLWLEALTEELPGKSLRIRCHPSLKDAQARLPRGWGLSTEPDLVSDIADSKILLTMNSTAGLEAGAMGRPILFLWNENMIWLDSMKDLEELVVTTAEELCRKVRMLLDSDEARQNYAANARRLCLAHLGSPDSTVPAMVQAIRGSVGVKTETGKSKA